MHFLVRVKRSGAACLFTLSLAAGNTWSAPHTSRPHGPAETAGKSDANPATQVLETASLTDMDGLIGKISDRRMIFVGETHDRYDHHLNQLAVVKGVHAVQPNLAIGLEFFQQPFQRHLDDYVAGRISEKEMLKNTEYFTRWRYDYRLYRPILQFAKEKGIPLIALNVPKELTEKVGKNGFDGLADEDRVLIPSDMDRSDENYRQRIKDVYDSHPNSPDRTFEHFFEAQLLWDEGMADRAARYLKDHPDAPMVVLAGSGHIMYGQGIPQRLLRRQPGSSAILLNASAHLGLDGDAADYLLFPSRVELPNSGLMGVFLETEDEGVSIKGFSDDSAGEAAGMKKGDRILSIDSHVIDTYPDIRIALLDKTPGDAVKVKVLRDNLLLDDESLNFEVTLK